MLVNTGVDWLDVECHRWLWNLLLPSFVLYVLYKASSVVFPFLLSLRVEGKPNEWVLVLNNGNLKKAGIGLTTWRSPYDSVARFPSQINKVNFSTEAMTKEM
jgi:hypothetical protein